MKPEMITLAILLTEVQKEKKTILKTKINCETWKVMITLALRFVEVQKENKTGFVLSCFLDFIVIILI